MLEMFEMDVRHQTVSMTRRCLLCCLLYGMGFSATAQAGTEHDADTLREHYQQLLPQLQHNQFGRELVLESAETPSRLKGDIYAVLDYPFVSLDDTLNAPIAAPANWCDVLILHLNTKYCHAGKDSQGDLLNVDIGKKVEQSLADAYPVEFSYRSVASSSDYFQVDLNAGSGPLGTSDYRIELEALALDEKRTFLHLTYSYSYGFAAHVAMSSYLATAGSNKVGFTIMPSSHNSATSTDSHAEAEKAEFIGGVRGVVERNTVRYYLAIEAYLSGIDSTPEERLQQRLSHWFDATEQYPRQLHELNRQEYMQMKLHEYQRQQTSP